MVSVLTIAVGEFYALGTKEFEEGRRKGDLTHMREGCEKVFQAYVEATAS